MRWIITVFNISGFCGHPRCQNAVDRRCNRLIFSATACYSALSLYAIARPSVRPSVRHTDGWIGQRRVEVRITQLPLPQTHRVAPWL